MFHPDKIDLLPYNGYLVKAPDPDLNARSYAAILATCRTVYDEAKPLLYANTRFEVHYAWSGHVCLPSVTLDLVSRFLRCIRSGSDGSGRAWVDEDVSKFLSFQQARSVTLNITVDGCKKSSTKSRRITRLLTVIRGAFHLRNLHIIIYAKKRTESGGIQEELDDTMNLLGQVQCSGRVTSALDLSIAHVGLKSASYYMMLDKVKW